MLETIEGRQVVVWPKVKESAHTLLVIVWRRKTTNTAVNTVRTQKSQECLRSVADVNIRLAGRLS